MTPNRGMPPREALFVKLLWPLVTFCSKFAVRSLLYFHRTLSTSLHYLAKLQLRTRSTFSKSLVVFLGVVQVRKNEPDILGWRLMAHTYCHDVLLADWAATACHAWDLWRVLYLTAMHSERLSTLEQETPALISPNLWLPAVQIWTQFNIYFWISLA